MGKRDGITIGGCCHWMFKTFLIHVIFTCFSLTCCGGGSRAILVIWILSLLLCCCVIIWITLCGCGKFHFRSSQWRKLKYFSFHPLSEFAREEEVKNEGNICEMLKKYFSSAFVLYWSCHCEWAEPAVGVKTNEEAANISTRCEIMHELDGYFCDSIQHLFFFSSWCALFSSYYFTYVLGCLFNFERFSQFNNNRKISNLLSDAMLELSSTLFFPSPLFSDFSRQPQLLAFFSAVKLESPKSTTDAVLTH